MPSLHPPCVILFLVSSREILQFKAVLGTTEKAAAAPPPPAQRLKHQPPNSMRMKNHFGSQQDKMCPVSSINVNTVDIYTETWAKYFVHHQYSGKTMRICKQ